MEREGGRYSSQDSYNDFVSENRKLTSNKFKVKRRASMSDYGKSPMDDQYKNSIGLNSTK